MPSGYTILDHPADLGLEATGTSLAIAFANAGLALMSVIVDPAGVLPTTRRTLEVSAEDAEQLLVRWLDEILFQYDSGGFIPGEITVDSISPTHLTGTIRGELLDPGRHTSRLDVKAITYHQIEVRQDEYGGFVRVFLDI